jgi:hypothetical protein
LFGSLVRRLFYELVFCFVPWSLSCLFDFLLGWLDGWLVDRLVGCLLVGWWLLAWLV